MSSATRQQRSFRATPAGPRDQLIALIDSRRAEDLLAAGPIVTALGAEAVPVLLAAFGAEWKRFRKRKRLLSTIEFGLRIASAAIAYPIMMANRHSTWSVLAALTIGPVAGLLIVPFPAASRRQRNATALLAFVEDIRAVGPLIDGLTVASGTARQSIINALMRTLPKLRSTEAGILEPRHLKYFYSTLRVHDNWEPGGERSVDIMLAVLAAVETVGDEKAIPVLRELTRIGDWGRERKLVSQAAARSLDALRHRLDDEREGRYLLRPAADPVARESLLRAAGASESGDSDRLLRADLTPKQAE